jgi:hypothetical protein
VGLDIPDNPARTAGTGELERDHRGPDPDCERCRGTGLVTATIGGDGYGDRCCALMDCDDQPCPECCDVRMREGY